MICPQRMLWEVLGCLFLICGTTFYMSIRLATWPVESSLRPSGFSHQCLPCTLSCIGHGVQMAILLIKNWQAVAVWGILRMSVVNLGLHETTKNSNNQTWFNLYKYPNWVIVAIGENGVTPVNVLREQILFRLHGFLGNSRFVNLFLIHLDIDSLEKLQHF